MAKSKLNLKISYELNAAITEAAARRVRESGRHVTRSDIVRWAISRHMKRPAAVLAEDRTPTPRLSQHFMLSAMVPQAHLRMLDHAAQAREAGTGIITTRSWMARRALATYLGVPD